MFESIGNFFKKIVKPENKEIGSKDSAKERLHLVLMQDRANVSADFLELMKQEIIDVIKKYIVVDEESIDVRLTNKMNDDGTNGAPALYANIPIINIKNDMKAEKINDAEIPNIDKKFDRSKEVIVPNKEEKIENKKVDEKSLKNEKKEDNNTKKSKKSEQKTKKSEKNDKEQVIKETDFETEFDEDDDDVTFDDLLRAAEEEDKKKVNKE